MVVIWLLVLQPCPSVPSSSCFTSKPTSHLSSHYHYWATGVYIYHGVWCGVWCVVYGTCRGPMINYNKWKRRYIVLTRDMLSYYTNDTYEERRGVYRTGTLDTHTHTHTLHTHCPLFFLSVTYSFILMRPL